MKKSIVLFLFVLLILNIFVISLIKAQDSDSAVPPELQGIQKAGEKLTDEEQRIPYLKQEWGKIFAKNEYTGPIIASYEKISPYTDPVSKYTIGLEPSLTWLFVLTLALWIAFVIYIFRVMEIFSLFSPATKYIISIGLVIIISITGALKKLAGYIINTVSLFNTWWMQLIGIVIVIIGLVVASIFSKNLKDIFKAMKENRNKAKEELKQAKLERKMRVAEGLAEGLSGK